MSPVTIWPWGAYPASFTKAGGWVAKFILTSNMIQRFQSLGLCTYGSSHTSAFSLSWNPCVTGLEPGLKETWKRTSYFKTWTLWSWINFLGLLEQGTTNWVTENNRNVFSHSSGAQKLAIKESKNFVFSKKQTPSLPHYLLVGAHNPWCSLACSCITAVSLWFSCGLSCVSACLWAFTWYFPLLIRIPYILD